MRMKISCPKLYTVKSSDADALGTVMGETQRLDDDRQVQAFIRNFTSIPKYACAQAAF